jgi:hypothetical protein
MPDVFLNLLVWLFLDALAALPIHRPPDVPAPAVRYHDVMATAAQVRAFCAAYPVVEECAVPVGSDR